MPGRIPQDFIDDLVARADVVEVIGRRVQLKKAGREFKACCPFHDEKTPSFTVSPSKGFYHCFGCGAHGTAVGFLMEYDHMSFVEAIENLASLMGVDVPRDESDRPARRIYDGNIGNVGFVKHALGKRNTNIGNRASRCRAGTGRAVNRDCYRLEFRSRLNC